MTVYKPIELKGAGYRTRIKRGWDGSPLWLATYTEAVVYLADIAPEGVEGWIAESEIDKATHKYENGKFAKI